MLSRKNIVIISGLIVVALLLGGSLPGLLTLVVDTAGDTYYVKGVAGNSLDAGAPRDLLDATSYVTSWTSGDSEKIVIQGYWTFYVGGPVLCSMEQTWYVVTVEGEGSGVLINGVSTTKWTSDRYNVGGGVLPDGQWNPLNTVIVTLTNPFVGSITVELWAYHKWDILLSSGDDKIAQDKAYLRSGLGRVTSQNDIVEEETDAKFTVETGYSTSTKPDVPTSAEGWFFNIFCLRTGANVYSRTVGDNYYGTVTWPVPAGTFVTVGDNTFRAVLRNNLLDIAFDDTFVIGAGMMDQIPSLPTFELIQGTQPFQQGESISIQVTAKSNTITDSPITGFWVNVYYETVAGGFVSWVYDHKWYKATPTMDGGTATVSWTFSAAGYVRMTASAQDANNLNSGNAELSWKVVLDDQAPPGDDLPLDINFSNLAIVLILIVAAIIIYWKIPLPEYIKWVIILILFVVAAYFAMGIVR